MSSKGRQDLTFFGPLFWSIILYGGDLLLSFGNVLLFSKVCEKKRCT